MLGRDASWETGNGELFTLLLEFSADGVTFREWIRGTVARGVQLDKLGNPLTQFKMSGSWPGEADAQGNRVPLKAAALRVTLTAPITFSVASVSLVAA